MSRQPNMSPWCLTQQFSLVLHKLRLTKHSFTFAESCDLAIQYFPPRGEEIEK
jgi:hypothetical protein